MVIPTCLMLYSTHGLGDVSPHGHKMTAAAQILCLLSTEPRSRKGGSERTHLIQCLFISGAESFSQAFKTNSNISLAEMGYMAIHSYKGGWENGYLASTTSITQGRWGRGKASGKVNRVQILALMSCMSLDRSLTLHKLIGFSDRALLLAF